MCARSTRSNDRERTRDDGVGTCRSHGSSRSRGQSVIFGARSIEQLEDNLKAADVKLAGSGRAPPRRGERVRHRLHVQVHRKHPEACKSADFCIDGALRHVAQVANIADNLAVALHQDEEDVFSGPRRGRERRRPSREDAKLEAASRTLERIVPTDCARPGHATSTRDRSRRQSVATSRGDRPVQSRGLRGSRS